MTRITHQLHKNVFSVIMDIFEMDHFREPELEEVELFLESTGTHGSIVDEGAFCMECTLPGVQSQEVILFDFEDSLKDPIQPATKTEL